MGRDSHSRESENDRGSKDGRDAKNRDRRGDDNNRERGRAREHRDGGARDGDREQRGRGYHEQRGHSKRSREREITSKRDEPERWRGGDRRGGSDSKPRRKDDDTRSSSSSKDDRRARRKRSRSPPTPSSSSSSSRASAQTTRAPPPTSTIKAPLLSEGGFMMATRTASPTLSPMASTTGADATMSSLSSSAPWTPATSRRFDIDFDDAVSGNGNGQVGNGPLHASVRPTRVLIIEGLSTQPTKTKTATTPTPTAETVGTAVRGALGSVAARARTQVDVR
jgi:hypothetical protein